MPGELAEILKPEPFQRAAPRAERDARLPGLNDPYQAAGTPENNDVSRLVLVMGQDGFKIGGTAYLFLQYAHISMGDFGFTANGHWFRFVWADIQPKLVTVQGRNLLRTCDYISLRRMPWIRQADRDLRPGDGADDAEPFIRWIDVRDWKRPKREEEEPAQAVAREEELA